MKAIIIKNELWYFVYAHMKFFAAFPEKAAADKWAEERFESWEIVTLQISEK